MDWHKDDEMYDMPQLEMVYCLENTSDSETEWIIDRDEGLCSSGPHQTARFLSVRASRVRVIAYGHCAAASGPSSS